MESLRKYFSDFHIEGAWEFGGSIRFVNTGNPVKPFYWNLGDAQTWFIPHPEVTEADQAVVAMQLHTLHKFLKKGPVIVRPPFDLCKALIDTELNFACREYHQPFEVMGVELPREIVGSYYPCLTVIWRVDEEALMGWTFVKQTGITYHLRMGNDLPTLEDRIARQEGVDDETDFRMLVLGSRVALNVCMLATQRQTETVPLPREVRNQRQVKNRRLRRLGFEQYQEIRFRDIVVRPRPHYDVMERLGGKLPKQHRSGHWKHVARGPRLSLRELRWISEYDTRPAEAWPDDHPPTTIIR